MEDGIVAAGHYVSSDSSYRGAVVVKTDFDGNKVFVHDLSYPGSRYHDIREIIRTSDAGFMVVGRAYEDNFAHHWVVKLDSNGCVGSSCDTIADGLNEFANLADFEVTPTLTSGQIKVTYASHTPGNFNGLSLQIHNLSGVRIEERRIDLKSSLDLDLSSYPVGAYFAKLADENGQILAVQKFFISK